MLKNVRGLGFCHSNQCITTNPSKRQHLLQPPVFNGNGVGVWSYDIIIKPQQPSAIGGTCNIKQMQEDWEFGTAINAAQLIPILVSSHQSVVSIHNKNSKWKGNSSYWQPDLPWNPSGSWPKLTINWLCPNNTFHKQVGVIATVRHGWMNQEKLSMLSVKRPSP